MNPPVITCYEIGVCARVEYQAHSLSNEGSLGTNRLHGRRQLLANGVETDALSGNLWKHWHATLAAEYLVEAGSNLCEACRRRDGRRAAGLASVQSNQHTIDEALRCGLCDLHGFLITGKKESAAGAGDERRVMSKSTVIEFSMALGLPDRSTETLHTYTRHGEGQEAGQMILKMPARSACYSVVIRYTAVGIGMDTYRWHLVIQDEDERLRRHRAALSALRDQLLSPNGAMTARQLPQLTAVEGALYIRTTVGRSRLFSPLDDSYLQIMRQVRQEQDILLEFQTPVELNRHFDLLLSNSVPYTHGRNGGSAHD